MERLFLALGAISAGISVAAGAFGAHGLKSRIPPELLTIWETGARYQMYHAFALMAAAWALSRGAAARGPATWAGWLFVVGTVIFSGSLYALAFTGIRAIGAVTVLGGVAFLVGWVLLALAALRVD